MSKSVEEVLGSMRFSVVKLVGKGKEIEVMEGTLTLKDAARFAKKVWQHLDLSKVEEKLVSLKIDEDYISEMGRTKLAIVRIENDSPEVDMKTYRAAQPPRPKPIKDDRSPAYGKLPEEMTPEERAADEEWVRKFAERKDRERRKKDPWYARCARKIDQMERAAGGRVKVKLDP